jgi:hypothetical protein
MFGCASVKILKGTRTLMSDQPRDKAREYLANALAAEAQAANTADPQLKSSFQGIAPVYREMAERARKLDEDETLHH